MSLVTGDGAEVHDAAFKHGRNVRPAGCSRNTVTRTLHPGAKQSCFRIPKGRHRIRHLDRQCRIECNLHNSRENRVRIESQKPDRRSALNSKLSNHISIADRAEAAVGLIIDLLIHEADSAVPHQEVCTLKMSTTVGMPGTFGNS